MTRNRVLGVVIGVLLALSSGQATNTEESKVPRYTLADPLALANGERVTTPEQWQTQQRPVLLARFRTVMYGQSPATRPQITTKQVSEQDVFEGRALRRQLTLCVGTAPDAPELDVLIYLPRQAAPVPLFLGMNFKGNHTVQPDPGIRLCRSWLPKKDPATAASRGSAASRWPVDMILAQGFGVATLYYGDIDPDFDDGFKNGVHARYPMLQEREDNFSSIAAWAWGLSCVMDYLETDARIDARHIAVLGHSRLGKAALWAGATDERFSLVVSNDSGSGGAALFRRCFGERITNLNTSFPHWFCRAFKAYNDQEDRLPFDQHLLIALMAPRPVYVASATEDTWADPRGEFLAAQAANPVYRLFGHEGLPADQWPAPDHPVHGRIGYHLRTGPHDLTAYDWTQYLAFAKEQWFPSERQ